MCIVTRKRRRQIHSVNKMFSSYCHFLILLLIIKNAYDVRKYVHDMHFHPINFNCILNFPLCCENPLAVFRLRVWLLCALRCHTFYRKNDNNKNEFSSISDTSFQEFVNSPCMTEIKERSCFIHVDGPGHADNAQALPDSYVFFCLLYVFKRFSIPLKIDFYSIRLNTYKHAYKLVRNVIRFVFPSLKTLGEDLVTVLDFLHVKYVIGLGEGAGANVLARFGLAHAARCLGLILINCTGSAASVLQSFKTKVNSL